MSSHVRSSISYLYYLSWFLPVIDVAIQAAKVGSLAATKLDAKVFFWGEVFQIEMIM